MGRVEERVVVTLFFCVLAGIVGCMIFLGWRAFNDLRPSERIPREEARAVCYADGYPELRSAGDPSIWYCYNPVTGAMRRAVP